MGSRFLPSGFARQSRTDLQTLFCRRFRGGPSLSERALALDRIAGSIFLVSLAGLALWFADQTVRVNLLGIPLVSESAEAASGMPDLDLEKIGTVAAKPLTRADIRTVQDRLLALGFDPGPVDGIAGLKTLRALNQYRGSKAMGEVRYIDRPAAADLLN